MVRLGVRHLLAAAFLAAVAPAAPAAAQQHVAPTDDDAIVLVANPDVPVATLAPSDARRIFLLRQRFWPHGQHIAPVNLPAASPLRRDFSLKLLGRSVREMSEYWNEMYFHGTEPPAVLESERAVLLYVARTPGAIGYIRAATLRAAPERDDLKILLTIQP